MTDVLAVDAQTANYVVRFLAGKTAPKGLAGADSLAGFATGTLARHPIAVNGFIETEYSQCANPEFVRDWIKGRAQQTPPLAVPVEPMDLPRAVKRALRVCYGIANMGRDCRYLETAHACEERILVSHDPDFRRKVLGHPRRPRMDVYLARCECEIRVLYVDEVVAEFGI